MEEMKYYTPDKEDIKIGYQCEWKDSRGDWCKMTVTTPHDVMSAFDDVLRTPFLTKEQIEGEGWVNIETKTIMHHFKKEDYYIYFDDKDHTITISKGTPPLWLNIKYTGSCPSINEFRTILKLLGI